MQAALSPLPAESGKLRVIGILSEQAVKIVGHNGLLRRRGRERCRLLGQLVHVIAEPVGTRKDKESMRDLGGCRNP